MPVVACPTCGRNLRVPGRLAGRRVTCPKCGEALRAPDEEEAPAPETEAAPEAAPEAPWPLSARLGMAALALGLVSVLILCLPWIGYASIVLSGVGLLLGVGGLLGAWRSDGGTGRYALAGDGGESRRFGERARDYPLAGVGACLLALALALLPLLPLLFR